MLGVQTHIHSLPVHWVSILGVYDHSMDSIWDVSSHRLSVRSVLSLHASYFFVWVSVCMHVCRSPARFCYLALSVFAGLFEVSACTMRLLFCVGPVHWLVWVPRQFGRVLVL